MDAKPRPHRLIVRTAKLVDEAKVSHLLFRSHYLIHRQRFLLLSYTLRTVYFSTSNTPEPPSHWPSDHVQFARTNCAPSRWLTDLLIVLSIL